MLRNALELLHNNYEIFLTFEMYIIIDFRKRWKCLSLTFETVKNFNSEQIRNLRAKHAIILLGKQKDSDIVGKKMIREASPNDLDELLHLYLSLHEMAIPEKRPSLQKVWQRMVEDPDHHIIVKALGGKIVSSCICVVIPNLTRGLRPYALIENVVTHHDFRGKGYASECLDFAKKIATEANCYKMMLLTGSQKESTWNFYKRAGYNHHDKTAFNQWLD